MVLWIFKIAVRLRDQHVFMWKPLEILNAFTSLPLELIFWQTKKIFQKLEWCFFVESTKIKCALFPHKFALPDANVKINRMESTQ